MVDYANEIYCEIHPDEQCSPGNIYINIIKENNFFQDLLII